MRPADLLEVDWEVGVFKAVRGLWLALFPPPAPETEVPMDAKRLVPVVHVLEGRVVDPADAADLGAPAEWARRLELEGADGLLFVERGRRRRLRQAWMVDVAP